MCGICGRLDWHQSPENEAAGRGVVERMTARLAHRGPDGDGFLARGPLVLGHRRLAVIDLDEASDQPIADVSGRFFLVFNGEIYNYREIRRELEGRGARFRSQGDSEVILEAYKAWGTAALDRLNGMFAFALWDEPARRLLLARDRLGKKPLYYQNLANGGLVFASEINALWSDPEVSREISPAALSHYLSLNYTLTEAAILRGVEKLPPAHFLLVEEGKPPRQERYWDLAACFHDKARFRSEDEAAEAVRELLDDAVRLRLISDVPLGAFLSGGIDSSAIVAAMVRERPPASVHTFSIGFAEPTYNELAPAAAAARFLGVSHHGELVGDSAAAALPAIVARAGEPFADTSMIPTYFLARYTRERVTVALSGDGGDELFAGYETYVADRLQRLARRLPGGLLRLAGRAAGRLVPVSTAKVSGDYKLKKFLAGAALPPSLAHYFWRTIFSPEEKARLLPDLAGELAAHDPYPAFARFEAEVAGCHPLDRAQYVDIKTWLADDILVKVDRCAMAWSLEPRAPFLDHRLVELAARLPPGWKLKGREKKHILKRSLRDRLPASIIRRKKAGFNAPVAAWLLSSLRPHVEEGLLSGRGRLPFDPRFVRQLFDEHRRGVADHSLKLFGLLNLTLWTEELARG